jgi:hypothetical protein
MHAISVSGCPNGGRRDLGEKMLGCPEATKLRDQAFGYATSIRGGNRAKA